MRSRRLLRLMVVTATTLCACTTVASAAEVIGPTDGETVGSRPTFAFDFTRGNAAIEFSHAPETKTAGDDTGGFVDEVASDYFIVGGEYTDGPPYILDPGYPPRLVAG